MEKKITIRMAAFVDDVMKSEQYVRANDPGYLMSNTSTPKPYDVDLCLKNLVKNGKIQK